MSRIIHSQTRPLWARPLVIGGLVAVGVGLVLALWRAGGASQEAEPSQTSAPVLGPAAGASSGGLGAAAGLADGFPNLRMALIAVELNQAPPAATLEVEARQGRFSQGQDVFPGVRLDRVFSDRVVLVHGQASRVLRVAPPAAAATAAAPDGEDPNEIRVRNKRIDPKQLTLTRPLAADAFLREVLVAPSARGGFVVEEVMPGSLYDKLGLRRGDVVYSLDVPGAKPVDETSMISLMQQTVIEMEVHRQGVPVRLRHDLTAEPEAAASAPSR